MPFPLEALETPKQIYAIHRWQPIKTQEGPYTAIIDIVFDDRDRPTIRIEQSGFAREEHAEHWQNQLADLLYESAKVGIKFH